MKPEIIKINRKLLYVQVWSQPMYKLAKAYGLSRHILLKICNNLNIPLPEQGYWDKKRCGQPVHQVPLPMMESGEEVTVNVLRKNKPHLDSELQSMIGRETSLENTIKVATILRSPHPFVEHTKRVLDEAELDEYGYRSSRINSLNIRVTPKNLNRALRIMDALIKALERRNFVVSINTGMTFISVMDELLIIELKEIISREITHSEHITDRYVLNSGPSYTNIPSGRLSLKIKNVEGPDIRKAWSDGKKQQVEESLNDFIIGLIKAAIGNREARVKRAELKKAWEEERKRLYELQNAIEKEKAQLKALESNASEWLKSKMMFDFISAFKEKAIKRHGDIVPGSRLEEFILWATRYAKHIDPLDKILETLTD